VALQQIVEQTVTGLGYELVEIERSAGGLLRITIDLPWQAGVPEQFVNVEDCEKGDAPAAVCAGSRGDRIQAA
jgi:ribosome maturation factor RimP